MMHENIIKAIADKRLIDYVYRGHHRVAEPHVFGYRNGVLQLAVYQVGGESRTGSLPNWRCVSIHDITALTIGTKTFRGKRSFPSGQHSSFDNIIAVVD
jgi:hypothetical protein